MFAFILGSNPALSVSEILAVLKKEGTIFSVLSFSMEALVITTNKVLEPQFIEKLGGTIKIVEITNEIKKEEFPEDFRLLLCHPSSVISASLLSFPRMRESSPPGHSGDSGRPKSKADLKKLKFGISLYFLKPSNKLKKRVESSLKAMAINLKKDFQAEGIKTGFISKKERNLSSVSVQKNGLLKNDGLEICIFLDQENIYIGKTISVQDFEKYSERDFGRPKRDILSGTTPPKLAKLMINLAGKNPSSFWQAEGTGQNQNSSANISFLDPFCGSGTYISEAYLFGFENITGTDKSEKAISDTKENLEWLKNTLSLSFPPQRESSPDPSSVIPAPAGTQSQKTDKEIQSINIFQADARELTEKIAPDSIDLVVTESYLGEPLREKPNKEKAKEILLELSRLYVDSLKEIRKVLKKEGIVVIALSAFRVEGGLILSDIEEDLRNIGLELSSPLSEEMEREYKDFITPRGTFLYSRKDQIVLREVLVIEVLNIR